MKNTVKLLALLVVFVGLMLSSCQKTEDEVAIDPIAAKAAKIKEIKIEMNQAKYFPVQEKAVSLYKEKKGEGNGLKNATTMVATDPKLLFEAPGNDICLLPNDEFIRVWAWTAIDAGDVIDKGILTIRYNQNYQQIDNYQLYIGWENEWCKPVTISSNIQNSQTQITFGFSAINGEASFDLFTNFQSNLQVWLPLLPFHIFWETLDGAGFAGTMDFNPEKDDQIKITIDGIGINTNDYLKLYAKDFPVGANIILEIFNNNNDYDRTKLYFPEGEEYMMIPLTFSPDWVIYQTRTIVNNRSKYSERVERSCIQMISIDPTPYSSRIYVLR